MRRSASAALLCAALASSGHLRAQSPAPTAPIATAIATALDSAPLAGARVAVMLADATSGQVLFERDADAPMNPASDTKLITAAAALATLGPSHRFVTTLRGDAVGPSVRGALFLRGDGDPSLTSADLRAMVHDLEMAGVRNVDGDVVVDDEALGAEHTPPAFDQQPHENAPFRAQVSGASVDENTLVVHVRPALHPGAPAVVVVEPEGYAEVSSTVSTSAGAGTSVQVRSSPRSGGGERLEITGSVGVEAHPGSLRRREEDPSLATAWALRTALRAAGISVHGTVRVAPGAARDASVLASHASGPLSALLYEVGKSSNNLYAEETLLSVGARAIGRPPTYAAATAAVLAWCVGAGVDTRGLVLRNGSGLFDANRVSSRQLVQVLRAAWRDPAMRDEYVAQLAVGGDDGTLRQRLQIPGASRIVRAKTGTLDDVTALSGYVLTAEPGRALAFSILINGVQGRATEARALADRAVAAMVAWTRPPN